MTNYSENQKFLSNRKLTIIALVISAFSLILAGLSWHTSRKALDLAHQQFSREEKPLWKLTLDDSRKTIKLETPTDNVRFQRADVKYPSNLAAEINSPIYSPPALSGTGKIQPPSSELNFLEVSNEIEKLCKIKSPACISDEAKHYSETFPTSNTLLGRGLPVAFEIEYVYRNEIRRDRILYLLPLRKNRANMADQYALYFEQPQLIKYLEQTDDTDANLKEFMEKGRNIE